MGQQVVRNSMIDDFISLSNLRVEVNQNISILDNLTFSIQKNSFNILIGPTGSGKTTILKAIKGIIPYLIPYELTGTITINDEITSEQNFFKQSLSIGYLFQDFDLQFIGSTVEQELIFGLENMGQQRKVIRERLQWFLKNYPTLQAILHRNPHTLSGGELAQVVFISTIIADPDIILLDEPLTNLDSKSKQSFLDLLASYKGKKTIIVATHDIKPFVLLTDKFLVLNQEENLINEYTSKEDLFQNIYQYPWIDLSPLAISYYSGKPSLQ